MLDEWSRKPDEVVLGPHVAERYQRESIDEMANSSRMPDANLPTDSSVRLACRPLDVLSWLELRGGPASPRPDRLALTPMASSSAHNWPFPAGGCDCTTELHARLAPRMSTVRAQSAPRRLRRERQRPPGSRAGAMGGTC